jgi:hypothetical protein
MAITRGCLGDLAGVEQVASVDLYVALEGENVEIEEEVWE